MKLMVFMILLMVTYIAVLKPSYDPVEEKENRIMAIYVQEQDKILTQLNTLNNEHVNVFVEEWAAFAKEPNESDLLELKKIQANINKDPKIAERYTISWHMKNSLCGKVENVFGERQCYPGI